MKKILTIDDQKDNLITIEAVIKSHLNNCIVLSALSGKEGIAMAINEQPDVILLDIIMPLMDGYEVCEILKQDERTRRIPVVMVTAIKTDSKSRIRGLDAGADAFLSKPIDPSEFAAQVKVMLRIKEAEDRLRAKNESLEEIVLERTAQLNDSKTKYQALYENAPVPYQSLDEDGKIIAVNPAWLHTLNYSSEEVLGKFYGDFLDEDNQLVFKENFPKLKACGSVKEVPFKIKHKDGHYLDISLNGLSVYHPDGKFKQTYCVFNDVTQRNKFESEIKISAKKYKSLFNSIRDAILVADMDRNIIDSNDAFKRLFGYSHDEIAGKNTSCCYETEAQYHELGETIKENYNHQKPFFYTVNYKKKSGEIFPGETGLYYISDTDGKITGFIGLIRDITDRLQAEKDLKDSVGNFKLIFENSPIGIYMAKNNGEIIDANPSLLKLLGSPSLEATKQINVLNFPPLVQNGYAGKFRQCVDDGISDEFEMEYRSKWGKSSFMHSFLVPLLNSEGKVENVYTLIEDITARKRTEQVQKILYNIAKAVNTTDNLEQLIGLIRLELGTIIDTRNFFVALLDAKTGMLNLPFFADELYNITHFPAEKTLSAYVIKTKKPLLANKYKTRELESAGEIVRIGPESEIWLGIPLKIEGDVTGVMVMQSYSDSSAFNQSDMDMLEFVSDQISISIHRKKAEQDLQAALIHATESDRLKSTFLATMSHELRTPLNAIIGFSELIDEEITNENASLYAKTINTSGNQLLNIIDDLMDISLIESGEAKIRIQDIQIQTVLNHVNKIIQIEQQNIHKNGVKIHLIDAPNGNNVQIQSDPNKLKQILINLLKNALKFTPKGSITFGYEIEKQNAREYLKFFVSDTGIGISKDKQDSIFKEFVQLEDSTTRTYGGTGIGLSVAKKLTNHLGGRIWVESEVGYGSTFYFTIPTRVESKIKLAHS